MRILLTALLLLFCTAIHAQNIGIDISAPIAKLDIRHTSTLTNPTLNLYDNSAANFARLQFQNASGSKYWQIAGLLNNTDALSQLNFYHSVFGNVLQLTGDGKVGVGMTPVTKFDVNGVVRASTFLFSGLKTGYISLTGADFTGMVSSQSITHDFDANGSETGVYTTGARLIAPLHLPDGASITGYTVYFTDNSSADLNVVLYEYDMVTDASLGLQVITSTGTPGNSSLTATFSVPRQVNNQTKNYKLVAKTYFNDPFPGSSLIIRGASVTYTVSQAQ